MLWGAPKTHCHGDTLRPLKTLEGLPVMRWGDLKHGAGSLQTRCGYPKTRCEHSLEPLRHFPDSLRTTSGHDSRMCLKKETQISGVAVTSFRGWVQLFFDFVAALDLKEKMWRARSKSEGYQHRVSVGPRSVLRGDLAVCFRDLPIAKKKEKMFREAPKPVLVIRRRNNNCRNALDEQKINAFRPHLEAPQVSPIPAQMPLLDQGTAWCLPVNPCLPATYTRPWFPGRVWEYALLYNIWIPVKFRPLFRMYKR